MKNYFLGLPVFWFLARTQANDGFMQDFFHRFPNLPFGNINSFNHLHGHGPDRPKSRVSEGGSATFKRETLKQSNQTAARRQSSTPESSAAVTAVTSVQDETQATTPLQYRYRLTTPQSVRVRPVKRKHRVLFSRPPPTPTPAPTVATSEYYRAFPVAPVTPGKNIDSGWFVGLVGCHVVGRLGSECLSLQITSQPSRHSPQSDRGLTQ